MIERYAEWLIHRRWIVIAATVLVTLVAASGGRWLEFTSDYRAYFGSDNPQLIAFERLQDTYTKNDNVMIVLAPQDGEVFSRKTLAAVVWVTEQAWQVPYSIRVDSISNFQHTRADADELIVEDLIADSDALDADALAAARRVALSEPALASRLVSARGHVTGVNVVVQLPGANQQIEVPQVVEHVRRLAAEIEQRYPHLEVYLTGVVMMNAAFYEAAVQDLVTLVPLMYAVIVFMLWLLLRGFAGTFATLVLLSCSIAGAMGLAGWAGIKLTGPSSTAPTIILTLAVADSVHFLATMLHQMRSNGLTRNAAIIESLRLNFAPIFLTSLTTAVGFLTLNLGEVPPFADLGNIVAVGVVLAFIWSVSLLPALMAVLPLRAGARAGFGTGAMERLAGFVVRRRGPLLWGGVVLILLLLACIPRNELNDQYVEYFDRSFAFRQATEFLTDNLTGLYDIHYSLAAGEAEGISRPEFLAEVEAFANWYRQQPEVVHVGVLTDTIKRLNKNLHGDQETLYRLPEQRELAAQYLLLYEMSLPYGLDLNNQLNVDKSATRLSVTLQTLTTNQLLALERRAQDWLAGNGSPALQTAGASPSLMFAYIGYRNIRAMLLAAVIALMLISAILVLALRSLKPGSDQPAAESGAGWGGVRACGVLWRGEVGLALSVVAGVTIGIVVDDTIHFMSKYLRARREQNMSAEDAVRYAFRSVGIALLVTTLVLAAGFLVLALSPFRLNANLGLMTAITICYCPGDRFSGVAAAVD